MYSLFAICAFAFQEAGQIQQEVFKHELTTIEVKQPLVRYSDRVELSFPVSGKIKTINFEEGQYVEEGFVLAVLENDREVAELEVRKAKAEAQEVLETAKARVASSKNAKQKALEANQAYPSSIPNQELRRLDLDYELSCAELREKKNELEIAALEVKVAKATVKATILVAPFSGVITRRLLGKGATVDGLKSIGQIVDTSKLRVEGYVSLDTAKSIRVGNQMKVVDSSGREIDLVLNFVDIGAQQVQKQVRVWGHITRDSGLVEGETVSATLHRTTSGTQK